VSLYRNSLSAVRTLRFSRLSANLSASTR